MSAISQIYETGKNYLSTFSGWLTSSLSKVDVRTQEVAQVSFKEQPTKESSSFKGMSLHQFGTRVNLNKSLQPESLLTAPGEIFRTNDFQNLEQSFDFSRPATRVGLFYISTAPYAKGIDNGGPGVNYPAQHQNTCTSITTSPNDVNFIFSSTEVVKGSGDVSYTRLAKVLTSQAMTVKYSLSNDDTKYILDYNVTGNAFHDVFYNSLTPFMTFSAAIVAIALDDQAPLAGPFNNMALPPAAKIKLGLNNQQTWVFYIEQSDPVSFVVNQNVNGLSAAGPMKGFIRSMILQPKDSPDTATDKGECDPTGHNYPGPSWSTALEIQTLPADPAHMYLLWPNRWVAKAGDLMTTLMQAKLPSVTLPGCSNLTLMLPVLAATDLRAAKEIYNQIDKKDYDNGTNPFLLYFNMLMAWKMRSDVVTYQDKQRPMPPYYLTPLDAVAETIEANYDQCRHSIPISTEVIFNKDSTYQWNYTTVGDPAPLVVFPSWKTLDKGNEVISDFVNKDAVKGAIYATKAVGDGLSGQGVVKFGESELPSWYDNFFPEKLNFGEELDLLIHLFEDVAGDLTLTNDDSYFLGKDLYRLALTAKYADFVLTQKKEYSRWEIASMTNPLINAIKNKMTDWLVNRTGKNYFVGDKTGIGVCALSGMDNASGCTGENFGSAFYNDHHFHYGYWLGAAAIVIDWDEKFGTAKPWIAQKHAIEGSGCYKMKYKMKYFIDMLWRDALNPFLDDELPYNRHGNPWEGHATANGMLCTPYGSGRNQESIAEDFNAWASAGRYARAIRNCSALDDADKQGMDTLQSTAELNMRMTASATPLWFDISGKDSLGQTIPWLYSGRFADHNITIGQQFDTKIDYQTFFPPAPPCPIDFEDHEEKSFVKL